MLLTVENPLFRKTRSISSALAVFEGLENACVMDAKLLLKYEDLVSPHPADRFDDIEKIDTSSQLKRNDPAYDIQATLIIPGFMLLLFVVPGLSRRT